MLLVQLEKGLNQPGVAMHNAIVNVSLSSFLDGIYVIDSGKKKTNATDRLKGETGIRAK